MSAESFEIAMTILVGLAVVVIPLATAYIINIGLRPPMDEIMQEYASRQKEAAMTYLREAAQASGRVTAADGDALAEMVHEMFRSGNSVPVERITITRKQYDAARSTPATEKGES